MNFNDIKGLEEHGFRGFKTIEELWDNRSSIPKEKGVYLVIDPNYKNTEYIPTGVGGFFKGKNPNVSISELKCNFVPNSLVVYIGKAGSLTGKATLNSRLGQYLRFGQTKNVGHWGGRYIWQIKNHSDLIFCWKTIPTEEPREIEKLLLEQYATSFNKRPFANLTG
ncbi:hypothetical protein ACXR6G_11510 [Ancylomarina sp. YFZ004]